MNQGHLTIETKMTTFQKVARTATLLTALVLGTQTADAQLSSKGEIVVNPRTGVSHYNELGNSEAGRVADRLVRADHLGSTPIPRSLPGSPGLPGLNAIGPGMVAICAHGGEEGYRDVKGVIANTSSITLADGTYVTAQELAKRLVSQKGRDGSWLYNGENIYLNACEVGRRTDSKAFGQQLAVALDHEMKNTRGISGGFTGYVMAPNGTLYGLEKGGVIYKAEGGSVNVGDNSYFAVGDEMRKNNKGNAYVKDMIPLVVNTPRGWEINQEAYTHYFADGRPPVGGATIRKHPPHSEQQSSQPWSEPAYVAEQPVRTPAPQPATPQLAAPTITYYRWNVNQIGIDWTPVSNASHYVIEYAPDPAFSTILQITVGSTTTSTNIGGLAANMKYYLRVKAVGAGYTDSDYSNSVWIQPSRGRR